MFLIGGEVSFNFSKLAFDLIMKNTDAFWERCITIPFLDLSSFDFLELYFDWRKWGLSFFSYLYWTILSYVEVPWCCLWSRWRYFNWECFPKFSHYQFWASNNSVHFPSLGWLDDFRFIRSRWMHWTQLLMTLGVFNTLDSLALCPFVR